MQKILISACLIGQPVRYDGCDRPLPSRFRNQITQWQKLGRLVPFCPELAGGLLVPRPPAEILLGARGDDVLDGRARITDPAGTDVTPAFLKGAQLALEKARHSGCHHAILTDRSPSCGVTKIHDGQFSGQLKTGLGVTAALLQRAGIHVWSENQIDALARVIGPFEKEHDK